MPANFLTDEQAERYGHFDGEPNSEQLARHFHLDDVDLGHARRRRGEHNRLGFAVQLCTVRFLGTLLQDPTDVPPGVADFVAKQLNLSSDCLSVYLNRPSTRLEHTLDIQRLYGYRALSDGLEHFNLLRWLYVRSWLSAATLVAFAHVYEDTAMDDALDVLDMLITEITHTAERRNVFEPSVI